MRWASATYLNLFHFNLKKHFLSPQKIHWGYTITPAQKQSYLFDINPQNRHSMYFTARIAIAVCLFCLKMVACSDVISLTADSFEVSVKKHDVALVLFYVTW